MGFNWNDLGKYKAAGSFLPGTPPNVRTFFSPEDNVHDLLLDVISACQQSFVGNMYGFTDNDVNQLLLGIHKDPNRHFQLALDSTQAAGVAEKKLLSMWQDAIGVNIAIGQSSKHAISHLKVAIIDGIYVVSGSTNWSTSGETKQDNELTITNEPVRAVEFRKKLDLDFFDMMAQMKAKSGNS